MENKKTINCKLIRNLDHEIAPEPILKAPPPTPCICLKQRSGSVPDVRIVDLKKEKIFNNRSCHRSLPQTTPHSCKPPSKPILDVDCKRPTSEHAMTSTNLRTGPWMVLGMAPCTSNLLHSVRQRLMNL